MLQQPITKKKMLKQPNTKQKMLKQPITQNKVLNSQSQIRKCRNGHAIIKKKMLQQLKTMQNVNIESTIIVKICTQKSSTAYFKMDNFITILVTILVSELHITCIHN